MDVRARVGLLAEDLFGGRVGERPQELARRREAHALLHPEREAEVHQARCAGAIDDDVRGLQVAVDHAAPVSVCNGLYHAADQIQARVAIELVVAQPAVQRLALDQLHRVPRAPLVHAALVDTRNAGVLEAAGQVDLAFEALALLRVGAAAPREDLQRDVAVGRKLARDVDRALTAAVDLASDLVAGDAVAREQGRQACGLRHLGQLLEQAVLTALQLQRAATRLAAREVFDGNRIDGAAACACFELSSCEVSHHTATLGSSVGSATTWQRCTEL